MMITIHGASDDLIEVEGCEGADEFYSGSDDSRMLAWIADLTGPGDERMRVAAWYDGCWHISVGQSGEDHPLPAWPLAFTQGPGGLPAEALEGRAPVPAPAYSVVLSIDAPEHTRLDVIWPEPEEDDR
jgi:hypothetical protein